MRVLGFDVCAQETLEPVNNVAAKPPPVEILFAQGIAVEIIPPLFLEPATVVASGVVKRSFRFAFGICSSFLDDIVPVSLSNSQNSCTNIRGQDKIK